MENFWKKLKYWQRGIIIGVILGLIKQSLTLFKLGNSNLLDNLKFSFVYSMLAGVIIFAIIGFVIGYLVGRTKGEIIVKKKIEGKSRSWLVAGIIGYVIGSLWNPYLSELGNWKEPSEILYAIIGVLSSGILYFFIGATVVYWISEKKLKKQWAILTVIFYIISVLYPLSVLDIAGGNFFVVIIFPLLYGSFFVSFAFGAITNKFYEMLPEYSSFVLIVIYDSLFFVWVYLEFIKDKFKNARTVILWILFAVLLVGMVSCANQLGSGF